MPGMVVTVSVKPGQAVKAGDPLVSIEAMKMETQIRADRDGTVRAVHVQSGETDRRARSAARVRLTRPIRPTRRRPGRRAPPLATRRPARGVQSRQVATVQP